MVLIRVNNYEIGEHEFYSEVRKLCVDRGLQHPSREIIEKAINNLIDALLVLNEAKKKNIKIPDDEVKQELLNMMVCFESEGKYNEYLKTIESTPEAFKKHLYDKLVVKKYLQELLSKECECDEEQLKKFYDDNRSAFYMEEVVRVSHILVKPELGIEKANQIRANIQNQNDFERVAKCCTNCTSCLQAGDLGYIAKGKMVTDFENVAFSLKIGEISEPVKTDYGCYIIMVTDKKRGITLPFDEVRETLKKKLQRIENELDTIRLLKELRDNSIIEISETVWTYTNTNDDNE